MAPEKTRRPQWVTLVSGGLAGGCEALCTCPAETVKVRVQLTGQGPLVTTRSIFANEGVSAFWKGVSALVLQSIPKKACRFVSFEMFKSLLRRQASYLLLLCCTAEGSSHSQLRRMEACSRAARC